MRHLIDIPSDIKALIFDCDGTLVDSMPWHMQAWEATLNHFGAEYQPEFLARFAGYKDKDIVGFYNEQFGTSLDPEKVIGFKDAFFKSGIKHVQPLQPAAGIASKYFNQLPLAVVSGGSRDIVYQELDIIGLSGIFHTILTSADPFRPKPAPDLFLEAAQRMEIYPAHCLVFEDGDSGLKGAQQAGMKTIDVRHYSNRIF